MLGHMSYPTERIVIETAKATYMCICIHSNQTVQKKNWHVVVITHEIFQTGLKSLFLFLGGPLKSVRNCIETTSSVRHDMIYTILVQVSVP